MRVRHVREGLWWKFAQQESAKTLRMPHVWDTIATETEHVANCIFKTFVRVQALTHDSLLLKYASWPYRLVDLLHNKADMRETAAVELITARPCQLDGFSLKLRNQYPSPNALLSKDCQLELQLLLPALVCNTFGTERLHSCHLRSRRQRVMTNVMEVSDIALACEVAWKAPRCVGSTFKLKPTQAQEQERQPELKEDLPCQSTSTVEEEKPSKCVKRTGGGGSWRAFAHAAAQKNFMAGLQCKLNFAELATQYWQLSDAERHHFREAGKAATGSHRLQMQSFPTTHKKVTKQSQHVVPLALPEETSKPMVLDAIARHWTIDDQLHRQG
eukprot:3844207-Amphidinium_carterae.3